MKYTSHLIASSRNSSTFGESFNYGALAEPGARDGGSDYWKSPVTDIRGETMWDWMKVRPQHTQSRIGVYVRQRDGIHSGCVIRYLLCRK